MIFVTVGTTEFSFDRLLQAVDKAMVDLDKNEELIVQKGLSNYQFNYKNTKAFGEKPFAKLIDYLKKGRVVITHGGPGTIFLSLKYANCLPLIIPRLKRFGEHIDNHQWYFAKFLKNKNLGEVILDQRHLSEKIKVYLVKPKKKEKINHSGFKKDNLVKNLINFTENLNAGLRPA